MAQFPELSLRDQSIISIISIKHRHHRIFPPYAVCGAVQAAAVITWSGPGHYVRSPADQHLLWLVRTHPCTGQLASLAAPTNTAPTAAAWRI